MTAERDPSPTAGRNVPAHRSGPPDVSVGLVVAARRGDPSAFARMVEHWDGNLRRFVHHSLGGEGSTDRVLAAAYVRAYRALPRYRGELAPGMWLHRIAYLAVTDELRRLSRDRARRRGRSAPPDDVGEDHERGDSDAAPQRDWVPITDDEISRVTILSAPSEEAGGPARTAEELDADPDLWTAPIEHDPGPASETIVEDPEAMADGSEQAGPAESPEPDEEGPTEAEAQTSSLPPGWRQLGPDQRALAVMVDSEGFSIAATALVFDTTTGVVADRLGSARRVLARSIPTLTAPEPGQAPPTTSVEPSAPIAPTAPAEPSPPSGPIGSTEPAVSSDPGARATGAVSSGAPPGQIGGAATVLRSSSDGGPYGAPAPSEWTTAPADEIEEVRVFEEARVEDPHETAAARGVVDGLGGEADVDGQIIAAARAVLASIAVPGPSEQFWADLGGRLLAERVTPAAPAIDPLARLARSHPAEPGFNPKGRKGRKLKREQAARARADMASPAVTSLADQADWVRPHRPWGRFALIAVVILAASGLLAVALRIGMSARIPDGSLTARELGAGMATALGQGPYQEVNVRVDEPGPTGAEEPRSFRVLYSADGSWLVSSKDRIDKITYDAATGTQRQVTAVGEGDAVSVMASETKGLAPGPPDPSATTPDLLGDLRSIVPLLRTSGDRRASATHVGSEETYTFSTTVASGGDQAAETWRVIVGRSDKLPLSIERRVDDRLVRRIELTGWRLRTTVIGDSFRQPLPDDVTVETTDHGFLTTDLAAVPLLGRPAVTPAWLPNGYELATVAIRPEAPDGEPTTGGGTNPPDLQVLALGFQRGSQQVMVTTRLRGESRDWHNPLVDQPASDESTDPPTARILGDGLFNGTRVEIDTDALGRVRLWGITEDAGAANPALVLTVSGDITAAEAYRLASSLR